MEIYQKFALDLASRLGAFSKTRFNIRMDMVNGQVVIVRFRPAEQPTFVFTVQSVLEHFEPACEPSQPGLSPQDIADAVAAHLNQRMSAIVTDVNAVGEGCITIVDALRKKQYVTAGLAVAEITSILQPYSEVANESGLAKALLNVQNHINEQIS